MTGKANQIKPERKENNSQCKTPRKKISRPTKNRSKSNTSQFNLQKSELQTRHLFKKKNVRAKKIHGILKHHSNPKKRSDY